MDSKISADCFLVSDKLIIQALMIEVAITMNHVRVVIRVLQEKHVCGKLEVVNGLRVSQSLSYLDV